MWTFWCMKKAIKLHPHSLTGILIDLFHKSHDVPFYNNCAHFCYKMVHCGMFALWDGSFLIVEIRRSYEPSYHHSSIPYTGKTLNQGSGEYLGWYPGEASSRVGIRHAVFMMTRWWRHQMETFSALLALSAGNSPVPVNSPHKGQWALMFSLICTWINDWVNNHEAGDLRRHRGHYHVIVMLASWREDLGSRGMCLGHVQVITPHSKLLDVIDLPCPDACFWHHSLPSGKTS